VIVGGSVVALLSCAIDNTSKNDHLGTKKRLPTLTSKEPKNPNLNLKVLNPYYNETMKRNKDNL